MAAPLIYWIDLGTTCSVKKKLDALVQSEPNSEKLLSRLLEVQRRALGHLAAWTIALLIVFSCVFVWSTIRLVVLEQSVHIWGQFHANLAICAPYITEKEEKLLLAQFTSIKTRHDYQDVHERMQVIAKLNNVALREESLW